MNSAYLEEYDPLSHGGAHWLNSAKSFYSMIHFCAIIQIADFSIARQDAVSLKRFRMKTIPAILFRICVLRVTNLS